MSKNDNDQILDFLQDELDRVDKWVSFAEAKNAAIVALNVALLSVKVGSQCNILLEIIRILLALSIVCALITFCPNMSRKAHRLKTDKNKAGRKRRNMIFFDDISGCEEGAEYLKLINDKYFQGKLDCDNTIYNDYAEEIVINSKIAVKKYKRFGCSVIIDIMAVIMMLIQLIVIVLS